MNKVIIVGHTASGFEEVESYLLRAGMKPALPSRREGVMPKELTHTLCKAHHTPPVGTPTHESDFQQIEAGMVWHGLALDLMLGNLEQDLWGWADTEAIFFLDYWRKLDPQITFVLVYDEPHRVLRDSILQKAGDLDNLDIQPLLDNWMAYNGALLRFFLRNQDRCLLVNFQQVGLALDDYLKQLRGRLSGSSQVSEMALQVSEEPIGIGYDTRLNATSAPLTLALHNALDLIGSPPAEALQAVRADAVWRYFIDVFLADHPVYFQFFEELQSVANMPQAGAKARSPHPGLAWQAFLAQREFLSTFLGGLHGKFNELQAQSLRVADEHYLVKELAFEELELSHSLNQQLRLQADQKEIEFKKITDELQKKLKLIEKKNEELSAELSSELSAKRSAVNPREAADRVRQQLSYRIGSIIISRSRNLTGWLGMPFALSREIRDWRRNRPTK